MSDHVIPAPPQAFVPVAGGGKFPVRRIFCVGRNYADHAREMGHDPNREPPFFFMKPADALVVCGAPTPYPPATSDLHHEIELVVALGQGGSNIAPAEALSHVWGYAVGLDLTRRDLQDVARKAGRPWDMAKGFDASAPIGELVPAAGIDPTHAGIALMVNGTIRQQGDLAQMIWPVADAIAYLSTLVALAPGDLIFTGTPAGVGAIVRGDILEGSVAGIGSVRTTIA
jgi:fumarylpyruvate hydrolase